MVTGTVVTGTVVTGTVVTGTVVTGTVVTGTVVGTTITSGSPPNAPASEAITIPTKSNDPMTNTRVRVLCCSRSRCALSSAS